MHVQYKEHGRKFDGLLGIGAENLFKIDKEEMEVYHECSRDELSVSALMQSLAGSLDIIM